MKSGLLLVAAALVSSAAPGAWAQGYPSRRDVEKWKKVVKEAKIATAS